MKIYSWNINGLRAVIRKGALQAFLETEHPDILCLQEIKATPEQVDYDFPGYQVIWNPAKRAGYSGTAVLYSDRFRDNHGRVTPLMPERVTSTEVATSASHGRVTPLGGPPPSLRGGGKPRRQDPPSEAQVAAEISNGRQDPPSEAQVAAEISNGRQDLLGSKTICATWAGDSRCEGTPAEPARWGQAAAAGPVQAIAIAEGRIQIMDLGSFYLVNVYTPNSKPDLARLGFRYREWDPEFRELLKELEQTKPVITCGDFNAAHQEIDIARPRTNHHSAGFTDQEREGVTNLINAGFIDTFRTLHPDDVRYTWWSHWGHAREHNVGWRIDYFFISKSLKPRLKSAEIYERYTGSDHCPISIEMEV